MTHRIFISHAAIDTQLATLVADLIRRCDPAAQVFVASRPGDIAAGQEWHAAIQAELRAATAYVVILTPSSVSRPWVWFETGAAWMSYKLLVPVLSGGLSREEVPSPADLRQLFTLEDPDQLGAILASLDLAASIEDLTVAVQAFKAAAAEVSDIVLGLAGWGGVTVEAVYYAWRGPHDALVDRQPVPEPQGLLDALRAAGQTPHWTRPDNLADSFARGSHQVFQTDRRSYRREIRWANLVLTVRSTG